MKFNIYTSIYSKGIALLTLGAASLFSCSNEDNKSDAYGNFEAIEVIVSAESNGQLVNFDVLEGQKVKEGDQVGLVDTVLLHLQKEEVLANIAALGSKVMSIHEQIAVYEAQHKKLMIDKDRLEKLFATEAATQQQLDQVNSSLAINEKQLEATRRKIKDSNRATLSQYGPLSKKVDVLSEHIDRCNIISPITGTVLQKYAERGEMTSIGRPLYKVANLSTIKVKAYATATQLNGVKIGQKVTVLTDGKDGTLNQTQGIVEWISDKAEFTPKTIQTKEERVSLIYAFKVKVQNKDGLYRIGMPAEINF
ncbi:HlyD family secretion protein [Flammeovirga kamogawensis]|uniref:HlyD family efflux transporter periplasmic adaptor subunit n=1 Tax=Flammeovirga kamogawensis TaxID=373891 RepID=A0ABX8GVX1_9BACT|nr:HlyD family efflux transporter periplasmic adaptor subunit [Flammeovirga kamogawensis]MBB6461177.1 HlyD family secretion protein [Flammeovirga kamogawensis]QWG07741.1 HlyD family efflux transporter periplasmic adaptor subunit [Flammeovirga kamogawensis]TRX69547.1 HlyD family efflux transporter periplasmic adaptor subunit [Flammeovirga kamogawensis]